MLIAQKLEEMNMNCKDARGSVSAFLLAHKADLGRYTMQQVADATYTSRPTLVRIAKRMGYSGWNELVQKYTEECRYYADHFSHISPNIPFEKGDTPSMIADKVGHVMVESAWTPWSSWTPPRWSGPPGCWPGHGGSPRCASPPTPCWLSCSSGRCCRSGSMCSWSTRPSSSSWPSP